MNSAKGLTDQAVALLENAVIHVLAKAHQLGCASLLQPTFQRADR